MYTLPPCTHFAFTFAHNYRIAVIVKNLGPQFCIKHMSNVYFSTVFYCIRFEAKFTLHMVLPTLLFGARIVESCFGKKLMSSTSFLPISVNQTNFHNFFYYFF
jgi:hypothetical protein